MGTKISIVENLYFGKGLGKVLENRFIGGGSEELTPQMAWLGFAYYGNDPSAGSPTETLLRLLLPLSDMVYLTSNSQHETGCCPKGSPNHSKSVGATGGVYKGQGLNRRKLMTCAY